MAVTVDMAAAADRVAMDVAAMVETEGSATSAEITTLQADTEVMFCTTSDRTLQRANLAIIAQRLLGMVMEAVVDLAVAAQDSAPEAEVLLAAPAGSTIDSATSEDLRASSTVRRRTTLEPVDLSTPTDQPSITSEPTTPSHQALSIQVLAPLPILSSPDLQQVSAQMLMVAMTRSLEVDSAAQATMAAESTTVITPKATRTRVTATKLQY